MRKSGCYGFGFRERRENSEAAHVSRQSLVFMEMPCATPMARIRRAMTYRFSQPCLRQTKLSMISSTVLQICSLSICRQEQFSSSAMPLVLIQGGRSRSTCERRNYDCSYFPAARLHDLNLDFLKAMAEAHVFRQERASLFVRVPVSHENDRSSYGFNSFVSLLAADWREHRLKNLRRRAADHWSKSRNDGVVRRILEYEDDSLRKAHKCFRLLEMQSPVTLSRLDRQQLWRAVYQSHVTGSASVPRLPQYDGLDLRDYLCAETIEDRGWYVLHGICPATVVSVFAPGEQFIAGDAMRVLTAHPGLSFRHTIITEFVSIEREKAKATLDSHIKHVERSGTRADGRYELTPEAEASFNDLKQTRRAITGSREALVKMRQYAVVYGDPSRTGAESATISQATRRKCRYASRRVSITRRRAGEP